MSYLITLAEYKAFFGITTTTTDTQVDALIPAIDNEINQYILGTGSTAVPTLIQQTYTEVYSGTGNNFIRLNVVPVVSIGQIIIGYNRPGPLTFSGSDFIYESLTGMVYFNPNSTTPALPGYFPQNYLNLQITYTAGYLQANVPQSIKRAAATMIQRILNLYNPQLQLSSYSLDQLTLSFNKNWLDINDVMWADVRRTLDVFKPIRYIF